MTSDGVVGTNPRAPDVVLRRDRLLLLTTAVLAVTAVLVDSVSRSRGIDPLPLARILGAGYAFSAAAVNSFALLDRASRDRFRRHEMRLFALAAAIMFGGQGLGYLLTMNEPGPFDSRAEVVPLLVGLPIAAFALLRTCWPTGMSRADVRTASIDSGVAILSLAVIWWQVVVPSWVDDPRNLGWVRANQVLVFIAFAGTAVLAVVSRRIGSLPFVQLCLLVGGFSIFFVADLLGQVLHGADDRTSVTYSLLGYVVAVICIVAFAHRAPVEIESRRIRGAREVVAAGVPLALALVAGLLVIGLAAHELLNWCSPKPVCGCSCCSPCSWPA
jgi:MFS family permease